MSIDRIQQYMQFFKNYNIIQQKRHIYGTCTTPKMKCLYILTKKTLSLSLSIYIYIYIYIHIFFFLSKRTGKDSSSVLVIVPKVNTGPDKIKILNRITLIKIKQHIIEPYPFSFFLFLVKNLFHYISRYHTNKITIHLESPLDSQNKKKINKKK